jgi:phosphoribosylamine--glycine ligase
VVLASKGYPEKPKVGKPIFGLGDAQLCEGVRIFHAATSLLENGWVTAGGRVLSVVGFGEELSMARLRAYDAVGRISFEGMHYRGDIAKEWQAL